MQLGFAILLGALAAALPSAHGAAAGLSDAADPSAVQARLSSMMQASNVALSRAEAHHKRTVKKLRKQVATDFDEEAKALSGAIGSYAGELLQDEAVLQHTMDASKAAEAQIKAAAARTGAQDDWNSPLTSAEAQLDAQISAAAQQLGRGQRARARGVAARTRGAEELVEDASEQLGLKLGDLSSVATDATQGLEARVAKATSDSKASATAGASAAVPSKPADAAAQVSALATSLTAARKAYVDGAKAADSKVDAFLAKASTDLEAKRAKIAESLKKAEAIELGKVSGIADSMIAPAKKVSKKNTASQKKIPVGRKAGGDAKKK